MIAHIEAERSLISALMLDNSKLPLVASLTEDDFTDADMRRAFAAMRTLTAKGKCVDLVTMDAVTGETMTAALIAASRYLPSSANIDAYIAIVRELSGKRRVAQFANTLRAAADSDASLDELHDMVQRQARGLAVDRNDWLTMDQMLVDEYTAQGNAAERGNRIIPTGFQALNEAIGGFFPGELTILAARTSVGKSALALNLAINAARAGKRVSFVTVEMGMRQNAQRVLTMHGADGTRLRNERIDGDEWLKLADVMHDAAGLPIDVNCKMRTIEAIKASVGAKVSKGECDLLIVDYLQKLQTTRRVESKLVRVETISAELKDITLDYDIPVIALAQVRRMEAGQRERPPTLEDLKDAGAIEQDADNVMFLHRVNTVNDTAASMFADLDAIHRAGNEAIVLSIEKARQGGLGRLAMIYDSHYRFHPIAPATRRY